MKLHKISAQNRLVSKKITKKSETNSRLNAPLYMVNPWGTGSLTADYDIINKSAGVSKWHPVNGGVLL